MPDGYDWDRAGTVGAMGSTSPAIVVGAEPPPARPASLLPALVALAAIVASVIAFQTGVRTTTDPPGGLRVVDVTTWHADDPRWTLSRVYAAPGGRGLAFVARRGAGNEVPGANTTIAGRPAVVRADGTGDAALLMWNHGGFGYTIVATGFDRADLVAVAEGIVYDPTGLGTLAVPRPGDLPADLIVVDQRSGPSAGPGTGPSGSETTLDHDGRRISVVASDDAVVTAAHLSGMLRSTPRGSEQLLFRFPETGGDGGLRWLIADRDGATVVASGVGVTTTDLARALAVGGA